jgi:hypothetical protein
MMGGQIRMTAAEFREAVAKQEEPSRRKEGGASGKHASEAPPPEEKLPPIEWSPSRIKRAAAAALVLLAIGFGIGSSGDTAIEATLSRLEEQVSQLSNQLDGQ